MDSLKYRFKTKLPSWKQIKQDGLKQKGNGFYKNIAVSDENGERNGCVIKLQTSSYCGQEFLNAELSAPKLFYGNNIEMLRPGDLEYLNDTVTSLVTDNTRIPFEANEAQITRLDLAYNWQTPNESYAQAYRDALRSVHPSKRLTQWTSAKEFNTDSIYWANKSQEILFYPKFAETEKLVKIGKLGARFLEQARGMVRLEHRWLDTQIINRELEKFGYKNCAGDLVPHLLEITQDILENDMKTLGLDRQIEMSGQRQRLEKLRDLCGNDAVKFRRMLALLTLIDEYGERNIPRDFINDKTFANQKTELKRLGFSLEKSKRQHVLPPLAAPVFAEN